MLVFFGKFCVRTKRMIPNCGKSLQKAVDYLTITTIQYLIFKKSCFSIETKTFKSPQF